MLRPFLFICWVLSFVVPMTGQEWHGRTVASVSMDALPVIHAAPFDGAQAAADDELREREGRLPLYGRFVPLIATPVSHGVWTDLPNGDRLWRVMLASIGALAIEVFLSEVSLPPGSQLHFHDPEGGQMQGGYTQDHVSPDGFLTTLPVIGERLVMEYYEPLAVRGQGWFTIDRLAHTYRMVEQLRSGTCQVDVNCSEGTDWSEQRDAVVRIRVVIPSGTGFCTGTLMNNTALDCTPYILTAFHCGEESTTANFSQYQFLFNYQRDCGSGTAPATQVMTGCVRRADSNDSGVEGGGTFGSDFLLVELNSVVPSTFNAFYAGWDATVLGSSSGVSIHQPGGDVKKISSYSSALTSASWAGFTSGSHWRVTWVATANGHGVTEPGSSGSPLFNSAKRVIGTLTGGQSCCTTNGCGSQTGLNQPDYYGKVSYHWDSNPNPPEEKLRLFLSPTGNFTTQSGSFRPCGAIGITESPVEAGFSVVQDPSSGNYRIRTHGIRFGNGVLVIRDATGRVIHTEALAGRSEVEFDPGKWVTGIYLVQVLEQGTLGSQRILVSRH